MARPLKYKTNAELEAAVDAYFKECEGEILRDENGEPMLYKGQPVITGQRPPTITGLAYALGFKSRQALLNYQGRKQFHDTILRAKLRIESYTEERLFDRDGVNGARFSLTNNFSGWSEHPTPAQSGRHEDDPLTESLKEMLNGNHLSHLE